MDFNNLQTHDWIDELKCTFCKNYLSYFPIYISSTKDNVCGRCAGPDLPSELINNQTYEIVAQDLEFPCRYQDEGCCEKLKPKQIPQHEAKCSYRTLECPTETFTKCDVKISYPNMIKHCHNNHSDLFLKNFKFDIDLSTSEEFHNLLEHNDQLLVITRSYSQKMYKFSVVHKENGATYVVSPYELNFTYGDRELRVRCRVDAETYINKISLDSLIKFNEKNTKLVGEIYLGRKTDPNSEVETINNELLHLLKCSGCGEYILPERNMNLKNTRCSRCQNQFYSNTSSLYSTMDKLVSLIRFPCQNAKKGCSFTSAPQEMKNHQEFCKYGTQTCPIKDFTSCNWNGFYKDLDSHFQTNHQTLLITSNTISENISNLQRNNNNYNHNFSFFKSYILRFGNEFFNLIFLLSNQRYYWIMQMIGEFKDMFKYEIEIIDNNKNVNKMIVTQLCSKQCKKQDLLNNLHGYCFFPSEQIQNFLGNQQELTFKVYISRSN